MVIAIATTIMIVALKDIIQLQAKAVPKARCFDKHTKFMMENGGIKEINFIQPGDVLKNGVKIMGKIKVMSNDLRMFNLHNIIVSESHIVNYNNKWLAIRDHPEAIEIFNYCDTELYCLNTSSKEIIIDGIRFTDWDEIWGDKLEKIVSYINKHHVGQNIDDVLFESFNRETIINLEHGKKRIDMIEIGEKLSTGGIVYGIVELYTNNLGNNIDKVFHLLVSNGKFEIDNAVYLDYNSRIDSNSIFK